MKITNDQMIQDFRKILKHFSKLPTFQSRSSPLRQYVLQQYIIGKRETNPKKIDSLRSLAHSYANMVTDIRELRYLRYLDTGEKLEQRDKIRATAARVGFAIPYFADERDGQSNNDTNNQDDSLKSNQSDQSKSQANTSI